MSLSLYQIEQDLLDILNKLDEQEGEITNELEIAIELNQQQFLSKSESYLKVIKNLQVEVDMVDVELERLQKIKASKNKTIDTLKTALKEAMNNRGTSKIETPIFKASIRHSKSVEILDEDNLPEQCYTYKRSVSKTEIKKLLDSNIEIPAQYKDNTSLVIK